MRSCQQILQSGMRSSWNPFWPQANLPTCDATHPPVQSWGPCEGEGALGREAASRYRKAACAPHGTCSGHRQPCHIVMRHCFLCRVGDHVMDKELIYEKLPADIAERHVLLMDPILATGNSAIRAIQVSSTTLHARKDPSYFLIHPIT